MPESTEILDQLKAVDLFASLSDKALKQLSSMGRIVDHPADKEILVEGAGSVGFHLILTGEALVSIGGKERPSLGKGQYFGEISLLDGKPRTAAVTAGPAGLRTHSVTAWDFHGMLEKHPEVYQPLVVGLCARLRAAEDRGA